MVYDIGFATHRTDMPPAVPRKDLTIDESRRLAWENAKDAHLALVVFHDNRRAGWWFQLPILPYWGWVVETTNDKYFFLKPPASVCLWGYSSLISSPKQVGSTSQCVKNRRVFSGHHRVWLRSGQNLHLPRHWLHPTAVPSDFADPKTRLHEEMRTKKTCRFVALVLKQASEMNHFSVDKLINW